MPPSHRIPWALALGLLVLLAPAAASAAWSHDPLGVPVSAIASKAQRYPKAISDGSGGMIVVWEDHRGSDTDIYAQRVDAQGNALWTLNGVPVITFTGEQTAPALVSDGSHGAIVAWADARGGVGDIIAQRLDASGSRLWTANGVIVCSATNAQLVVRAVADGSGGAFLAWQDYRNGNYDIYAQRLNSSGVAQWRSNGAPACSLATTQDLPTLTIDGQGGVFLAWEDYRAGSGYGDIYAQRLSSTGAPAWTLNGLLVCDAAYQQFPDGIAYDGNYGAYVFWEDLRTNWDVYAQRLNSSGTGTWTTNGVAVHTGSATAYYVHGVANGSKGLYLAWSQYNGTSYDAYGQYLNPDDGEARWTANGRAICTSAGDQNVTDVQLDGLGGLFVVWGDTREGGVEQDVYAQRLNASGVTQWTSGGVSVCTGPGSQAIAQAVPTGTGFLLAYQADTHDYADDIYAQYVERFGHIGDPSPHLTRVADVPYDQGGHLQVEWTASYVDTFPTYEIEQYTLWRQVPEPAALTRSARSTLALGTLRASDGRTLRTTVEGAQAVYWEQVGTMPARGLPGYSLVTATTSDSMPGTNPYTSYMVMAEQAGGTPFWASAADSGYSTDDLAPPLPAPFTGTYAAGSAYLQWGESPAPDFAQFRLYRDTYSRFVPGPENLVAAQTSCGTVDAAGGPAYYQLCAVDLHGNVSRYAFLQPNGTVDAPAPALPRVLALSAPAPNPLRGQATLRLALPRAARVTLAVLDAQGRRVRTLLAGAQPAGEHAITWDGRDDGGRRVADGIYVVRLACEGRVITRRVAALR
jgi:hypothetical protein